MVVSPAPSAGSSASWERLDSNAQAFANTVSWDKLEEVISRVAERTFWRFGQLISGARHLIRKIEFPDEPVWIVRLPMHEREPQRMRSEIGVMEIARQNSIPVPEVCYYEDSDANPVGTAYMLMEFVPGQIVTTREPTRNVPPEFMVHFLEQVAAIQVAITFIRFDKIGSVLKEGDRFTVGPIRGLGGPYSSAKDMLQDWCSQVKFPSGANLSQLEPKLREKVEISNDAFLKMLSDQLHTHECKSGPYPLRHEDSYNSNIIVNEKYDIIAIIDWEDASTGPWELVEYPPLIERLPPALCGSENDNEERRKYDAEDVQRIKDRPMYLEAVKKLESAYGYGTDLSDRLEDEDAQTLAYAIRKFPEGKLAIYSNALLRTKEIAEG